MKAILNDLNCKLNSFLELKRRQKTREIDELLNFGNHYCLFIDTNLWKNNFSW